MDKLYLKDLNDKIEVALYCEGGHLILEHYIDDTGVPTEFKMIDVIDKKALKKRLYETLRCYQNYRNNYYRCTSLYFRNRLRIGGILIHSDPNDGKPVVATVSKNPKLKFYGTDGQALKDRADIEPIISSIVDAMH